MTGTKWLIIIFSISILFFVFSFFLFYNQTDIFKFPFHVEVWGTFSDWTMVVVTSISAYYLIRTFREQKKLSNLEFERYLDTIHPELSYTYIESENQISFSFKKNPAYNIGFIPPATASKANELLKSKSFKIIPSMHDSTFKISIIDESDNEGVIFYLWYADKLNNYYEIEIIGSDKKNYLIWRKEKIAKLPYQILPKYL